MRQRHVHGTRSHRWQGGDARPRPAEAGAELWIGTQGGACREKVTLSGRRRAGRPQQGLVRPLESTMYTAGLVRRIHPACTARICLAATPSAPPYMDRLRFGTRPLWSLRARR